MFYPSILIFSIPFPILCKPITSSLDMHHFNWFPLSNFYAFCLTKVASWNSFWSRSFETSADYGKTHPYSFNQVNWYVV